jgi:hypothetical protein
MTPTTLNRVGTACFGNFWQTQMAEALGVNPRTLRRWLAGELPIPDLRGELLELIRKRRSLLLEARGWLN